MPTGRSPSIRTVLGDIAPAELGVCYPHEHIIIDPSVATLRFPEFQLSSVENAVAELKLFRADGGRAMVESMPCDAGRNVIKLAEISKRSGVHIVCPTGFHLAKYYDEGHWTTKAAVEQIAGLLIAEIEEGIDRFDYGAPLIERTPHCAGVLKIASGKDRIDDHESRIFRAAATAHWQTGCPILTHTEQGTAALEQVALLKSEGVRLDKVLISHTDRKPDAAYHREILSTGVRLEYDSCFRWKREQGNPSLDLLMALIEEFPHQLMLSMDAARPSYWKAYGGAPGLSFLLTDFSRTLRSHGLTAPQWDRIFVRNPAEWLTFAAARD